MLGGLPIKGKPRSARRLVGRALGSLPEAARIARQTDGFLEGPGQKGLVSAIVPAFNRESLVVDALESLARQSHESIQIIVVDDGSTDATTDVVCEWARTHFEIRIDIVSQPNGGAATARNAGLAKAQGEFIYFLDSDDVSEPFTLSLLYQTLLDEPDAPFALGRIANTDIAGNVLDDDYSGITNMREYDLLQNHWLLFAALYRREALRKAGPFNETLIMGEDTEINWRVIVVNGVGIHLDRVVGQRRHHNEGHLYLDSDEAEKMRRSIAMHRAIANWLAQHPKYDSRIATRGLIAMYNYYQRLGRGVDEDLWPQVTQLFPLLSPNTSLLNMVLKVCAQDSVRPAYWIGYRIYRKIRLLMRPLKRLVTR